MIENLYADIGYQSLTKYGEFLCGDHIEKIQQPDGSVVLVLADGLGSGALAASLLERARFSTRTREACTRSRG